MKPGLGNRQKLISENHSILKSITIDINYVNVIDFIYRSIKIDTHALLAITVIDVIDFIDGIVDLTGLS